VRDEPPSTEDLAELGQQLTADGVALSNSNPDPLRMMLRGATHHHAGLLSTMVALFGDQALRRANWVHRGDHDF
jgi:hypothetical protein